MGSTQAAVMRKRAGAAIAAAAVVIAVVGCSGDDKPVQQGSAADTQTTDGAASGVDSGEAADTYEDNTCKGVAQEHRRQFSQYDSQCSFLTDCPQTGKCSCGGGCAADKTTCSAALCQDVETTCYCGEGCVDEPTKRPLCPEFFCKQNGKDLISTCEALDGCTFVDKPYDAKCKCTAMPDHEPTCWCGKTCTGDKPACSAALCFGKDPGFCLAVPGKKHDNCYCANCGLKGNVPACFFVLCP